MVYSLFWFYHADIFIDIKIMELDKIYGYNVIEVNKIIRKKLPTSSVIDLQQSVRPT